MLKTTKDANTAACKDKYKLRSQENQINLQRTDANLMISNLARV